MAAAAAGPAGRVLGQFGDWIGPGPVAEQISAVSDLIRPVAGIVEDYITGGGRIRAFARNFWQQRGIDVGEVRPINPEFYEYWHGPDPIDPTRRVCDTHHWPVWIPEGLSLATVERAGLRFDPNDNKALRQHRNTPTPGGYYAVMRKEVLGMDLPEAEQIQQLNRAGYPGLAQAVDVAAVIFAINQYDGSRWLGDATGAENRRTFTRCVERVAFGEREYSSIVGAFAHFGMCIRNNRYRYDEAGIGAVPLRQF
jgi:hypothetical protein